MERIGVIDHRGRQILRVDYSGLRTLEELEEVAGQASQRMRAESAESHLVMVDMTGVAYSLRTFRRLSEMAAANAPHVRARAMVGLSPQMRSLVGVLAEFSDRPARAFDEVEPALDWLVEQDSAPTD